MRLNYAVRGRELTRCTPQRGGTEPRIGRIMCAILRACVAEGATEVKPASACMRRRIDSLDALSPAATTATIAAASPQEATPAPRPEPQSKSGDVVVTAPRQPDDIVVLGRSPMLRGGLWRFDRSATLMMGSGGLGRSIGYSICLEDGALEQLLRDAAESHAFQAGSRICNRLSVRFAAGRLDGRRSCTNAATLPSRLSVSGHYDGQTMTINYLEEQDHDGLEQGGGAGWNPRRPTAQRWQVVAHRQGACPAQSQPDQRLGWELASLLFSNVPPDN